LGQLLAAVWAPLKLLQLLQQALHHHIKYNEVTLLKPISNHELADTLPDAQKMTWSAETSAAGSPPRKRCTAIELTKPTQCHHRLKHLTHLHRGTNYRAVRLSQCVGGMGDWHPGKL
jgi:hypothetical protein